jgi:hypothetical protein
MMIELLKACPINSMVKCCQEETTCGAKKDRSSVICLFGEGRSGVRPLFAAVAPIRSIRIVSFVFISRPQLKKGFLRIIVSFLPAPTDTMITFVSASRSSLSI